MCERTVSNHYKGSTILAGILKSFSSAFFTGKLTHIFIHMYHPNLVYV